MTALSWVEQNAVVGVVRNEALKQGIAPTPELVERAASAVVRVTNQQDPMEGRKVVAVHLTPRRLDGTGGETVKTIQVGAPKVKEYARPKHPWAANDDLLTAPAESRVPGSQAEADVLDQTRARLLAMLPGLDRGRRQKAEDRILAIEDVLRRFRKQDQAERA